MSQKKLESVPYQIRVPLCDMRCITCGKVLAPYEIDFEQVAKKGSDKVREFLDNSHITRVCCRNTLLNRPEFVVVPFMEREYDMTTKKPI